MAYAKEGRGSRIRMSPKEVTAHFNFCSVFSTSPILKRTWIAAFLWSCRYSLWQIILKSSLQRSPMLAFSACWREYNIWAKPKGWYTRKFPLMAKWVDCEKTEPCLHVNANSRVKGVLNGCCQLLSLIYTLSTYDPFSWPLPYCQELSCLKRLVFAGSLFHRNNPKRLTVPSIPIWLLLIVRISKVPALENWKRRQRERVDLSSLGTIVNAFVVWIKSIQLVDEYPMFVSKYDANNHLLRFCTDREIVRTVIPALNSFQNFKRSNTYSKALHETGTV